MKRTKIFPVAVAICIILAVCATVYLCIHPIDKFLYKLSGKNFSISATVDMPLIGETKINMDIDGNLIHIHKSLLSDEMYIESNGEDSVFVYTRNENGDWVKETAEFDDFESEVDSEVFELIVDSGNYEKAEGENGSYKQKDEVDFGFIDDVKIVIGDGIYNISGKAEADGFYILFDLEISEFGDIEVAVPNIG